MSRIEPLVPAELSQPARRALKEHIADGYRVTNEKLTLLRNVPSFHALEVESYAVDRELQRLVGKRAADFFEYAISLQNDCDVCSTYFGKLLRRNDVTDFKHFDFTPEEKLLIEYGRAIAKDPKGIPDELFSRLKERFDDETIVVLTTMGVFMVANNYFNDILKVEPERE